MGDGWRIVQTLYGAPPAIGATGAMCNLSANDALVFTVQYTS
jgi:hypothetical protein